MEQLPRATQESKPRVTHGAVTESNAGAIAEREAVEGLILPRHRHFMTIAFQERMALGDLQVFLNHLGAHFLNGNLRLPPQFLFRFGGLTQ